MALDFDLAAGGYAYRSLRLTPNRQRGWDVYALQTALNDQREPDLVLDGIFGKKTNRAVREFQEKTGTLTVDGKAGGLTQRALALWIADPIRAFYNLPYGLLDGQLEHESSYWLGNHTPPYSDGKRDIGVAQRNENYIEGGREDGFHAPLSIKALAKQVSDKHTEYLNLNVVNSQRAWELAAGSWNRPAHTDALARGKTSVIVGGQTVSLAEGSFAREWIEAYIEDCTAYVSW